MTADSSNAAIIHSGDGEHGGSGVNSPSGRVTLRSPWAQVVRGGIEPDSERNPVVSDPVTADLPAPAPASAEGSDGSNNCNAGGVLISAWNKPSVNCVVEGKSSPVMDASSWPALSESTRIGVKTLSESTRIGSSAGSQGAVISQPLPKQVKPNSNHVRRAPMRVGGASVRPPPPPPLPPPFPLFDVYGNLVPAVMEFPQPSFKNNSNRNPARRNNFGPRPVNIGYGGRRDHHGPRSHMPHQMGPPPPPPVRGFVRTPFIPLRPLRAYGAPMGYEMGASIVYVPALAQGLYRGGAPLLPRGASGSSMFIPYWDSSLYGSILRQIEYYFSDENLMKDNFLRSHMDDEGWVPVTLIAGFQRVQKLTKDLQMILSSLTYSNAVEIQGDKVRRRTDWKRWMHIPREAFGEESSFQKLALEDALTNEKQMLANGDDNREDEDPCF